MRKPNPGGKQLHFTKDTSIRKKRPFKPSKKYLDQKKRETALAQKAKERAEKNLIKRKDAEIRKERELAAMEQQKEDQFNVMTEEEKEQWRREREEKAFEDQKLIDAGKKDLGLSPLGKKRQLDNFVHRYESSALSAVKRMFKQLQSLDFKKMDLQTTQKKAEYRPESSESEEEEEDFEDEYTENIRELQQQITSHTQRCQSVIDEVRKSNNRSSSSSSTILLNDDIQSSGWSVSEFSTLRMLTSQTQDILESLTTLLNKRANDIQKCIFRLTLELQYCNQFRHMMKNYVDKQRRDEERLGQFFGHQGSEVELETWRVKEHPLSVVGEEAKATEAGSNVSMEKDTSGVAVVAEKHQGVDPNPEEKPKAFGTYQEKDADEEDILCGGEREQDFSSRFGSESSKKPEGEASKANAKPVEAPSKQLVGKTPPSLFALQQSASIRPEAQINKVLNIDEDGLAEIDDITEIAELEKTIGPDGSHLGEFKVRVKTAAEKQKERKDRQMAAKNACNRKMNEFFGGGPSSNQPGKDSTKPTATGPASPKFSKPQQQIPVQKDMGHDNDEEGQLEDIAMQIAQQISQSTGLATKRPAPPKEETPIAVPERKKRRKKNKDEIRLISDDDEEEESGTLTESGAASNGDEEMPEIVSDIKLLDKIAEGEDGREAEVPKSPSWASDQEEMRDANDEPADDGSDDKEEQASEASEDNEGDDCLENEPVQPEAPLQQAQAPLSPSLSPTNILIDIEMRDETIDEELPMAQEQDKRASSRKNRQAEVSSEFDLFGDN